MQEERHGLNAVPLEYMPRPADREIRTRIERVDISVRGGMRCPGTGEEARG